MLIAVDRLGSAVNLAEAAKVSSAYLSQIKKQLPDSKTGKPKAMGDDVARKIEIALGEPEGWMDVAHDLPESILGTLSEAINLENNPDYPAIKKVSIRLSAGISGFAIDHIYDDSTPIVFKHNWYTSRGYKPENLFALIVSGQSMESGLGDGDTIVINTADTTPKDGEAFAVNYEGELVVKRLIRNSGEWWLNSDNPDQRRYPPKVCNGDSCIIIGRVIHKQSERI